MKFVIFKVLGERGAATVEAVIVSVVILACSLWGYTGLFGQVKTLLSVVANGDGGDSEFAEPCAFCHALYKANKYGNLLLDGIDLFVDELQGERQ